MILKRRLLIAALLAGVSPTPLLAQEATAAAAKRQPAPEEPGSVEVPAAGESEEIGIVGTRMRGRVDSDIPSEVQLDAIIGAASAQPAVSAAPVDITRAAAIFDAERRLATLDLDRNGTLDSGERQKVSEHRRAECRQGMEESGCTQKENVRDGLKQTSAECRLERKGDLRAATAELLD